MASMISARCSRDRSRKTAGRCRPVRADPGRGRGWQKLLGRSAQAAGRTADRTRRSDKARLKTVRGLGPGRRCSPACGDRSRRARSPAASSLRGRLKQHHQDRVWPQKAGVFTTMAIEGTARGFERRRHGAACSPSGTRQQRMQAEVDASLRFRRLAAGRAERCWPHLQAR